MAGNVKIVFKRDTKGDIKYSDIPERCTVVLTYEEKNVKAKDNHKAVEKVLVNPEKILSALSFYREAIDDLEKLIKDGADFRMLESSSGQFVTSNPRVPQKLPPYIVVELEHNKKR